MIRKWDGSPVNVPCILSGVPLARYHDGSLCDGPSISSSGLRTLYYKSPAHFWCESSLNPDRIEPSESEALVLGRAAHHLLLGEDDFSTLFIARPPKWDSWRTDAAKAWRAEQEAEGRTVLLPNTLEQIRGMARSLSAHPLIQAGILNGGIEQSMVWRDKDTGIWKRSRPDAVPNDSGDFADLKSTMSVSDDAIMKTIADYGLHMQGALVCEGAHDLLGCKDTTFSLVFVEKEPPYCCRVVTLRDEDLARGERQNAVAMRTFAKCLETGEWPGPGRADAEYVSLPSWAQTRIDRQLEEAEAA